MRSVLLAALITLAAPAFAQTGPDGKAVATPGVSEIVQAHGSEPLTVAKLRRLMQEMIAHQMKAEDQDLLGELAVGHAVEVTAGDKVITFPALTGDALITAGIMYQPPNLNTLWKQPGGPTYALVEISRWGDQAKNRIVTFMANKLDVAWSTSTINNDYGPFRLELRDAVVAGRGFTDGSSKDNMELLKLAIIEVRDRHIKTSTPAPQPQHYSSFFVGSGVEAP